MFYTVVLSLIWRQSHLPVGLDLEGDWDGPQHSDEGLWHHPDLLLPLNWEHHFCDPNSSIRESSLGHLAASLPFGSSEGEWAHKVEQPWEHHLPLESSAKPGAPCRPALDIHLFSSCHSSLIHLSCWEPVSTPLSKTCSVTCRMASSVEPRRVCMEGCSGAISLAASASDLWEHIWCSFFFMEATLWTRHSNKKSPNSCLWVVVQPGCSLLNLSRKIWPHSPVCHSVGTTSALGEILYPLPKDGKIFIIESNKFFHPVNVINNELCSDSDLRLTAWPRFTPLLSQHWTNNPYLPALMIRLELTHLAYILLIFIKPTLHDTSRALYNGLLLNKQCSLSAHKWLPPRVQLISCPDLSNM